MNVRQLVTAGLATSLCLAVAACSTTSGGARKPTTSWSLTAKSGQESKLSGHYDLDESCNSKGTPKIVVVKAPKNGTILLFPGRVVPSEAPCNARGQVSGVLVGYKSKPGFVGRDTATIVETTSAGTARFNITITVN